MFSPAHTAKFSIQGMSCGHCEASVRSEIAEMPHLTITELASDPGVLVVTSEREIDLELVHEAITEAGYTSTLISAS